MDIRMVFNLHNKSTLPFDYFLLSETFRKVLIKIRADKTTSTNNECKMTLRHLKILDVILFDINYF